MSTTMNLRATKLYRAIENEGIDGIIRELIDFYKAGNDVNVRDTETGETFVHVVVNHAHRFQDPAGVSMLYILCCKPVDLDAQDIHGETALHKVVRRPGAYRILVALIRCGADTEVPNSEGHTPKDVLEMERPEGWQETLHWLEKFRPGLWRAITAQEPDKRLVERLLRSWCRVTVFKLGKVQSVKCLMHSRAHQLDIVYLLEKYENSIEFALAMLAGKAIIVRHWRENGLWASMLKSIDVNTADHSYQYHYPDYPEVPQPLLAAVWETGRYETVDLLMELNPDTRVFFCNELHPTINAKPLFFHVISGLSRPTDERIVLRILRDCDLNTRGRQGQTVLYEAIASDAPDSLIRALFSYGVNVASRARCGRTARDLTEQIFKKPRYIKLIDEHVLNIVKECNIERLESLILQSYDRILDIRDENGKTALDLARASPSRQLLEVLDNLPTTQDHAKRIFMAIAGGNMALVNKLLSRKFVSAQDKCGRTILHHAILNKRGEIVRYIITEFPQVLNVTDNLGLTPLHYAYLFMDHDDTIEFLIKQGACTRAKDVQGWCPRDFSRTTSGQHVFCKRQRAVLDYDLELFLGETNFSRAISQAIKTGDMATVENLVHGLRAHGATKRFSNLLFLAVDHGQQKIANYLLLNGFSPNVFKQYEVCNPDDPMCAMMECDHSVTSFKQRVATLAAKEVEAVLNEIDSGKMAIEVSTDPVEPELLCQF